ncbi:hypothetical protein [Nonomuraea sp. NPDC050783]|uniref:hypothetical protein n=1 Tax=Nonomuraea sp. NPDC050783 TaxID=3154634 RepID=UPI0034671F2E
MDFHGWSGGLALRPRDYLASGGRPLLDVVRASGPFRGEELRRLALGTAATLARLHLAGLAGLRLGPGNVLIGPYGQAFFAPGPRDSEFPSHDVRAWAEVMLFAATGREPRPGPGSGSGLGAGSGPGPGAGEEAALGGVLGAVIGECRRPDPGSRPTAAELVAALLGRPAPATRLAVERLLREADNHTRPDGGPHLDGGPRSEGHSPSDGHRRFDGHPLPDNRLRSDGRLPFDERLPFNDRLLFDGHHRPDGHDRSGGLGRTPGPVQPVEPVVPVYAETLMSTPLWRRPAFLAGVVLGLAVVALCTAAVVLVSALATSAGGA